MFWGETDPAASLREIKSLGIRCGHLGIAGHIPLEGAAGKWKAAAEQEDFVVTNVVGSFNGEDYADIPTVQRTVGYVPAATRQERETRTYELIDLGAAMGVGIYCCHAGYIPEDRSDPDYLALCDMARRICDYAAKRDMTFALETGQETAEVLDAFIKDVGRPNLKINFDPANIILYGVGDPIEALDKLGGYVVSVHCKDGIWPPKGVEGALGTEKPLGEGEVGMERFIAKLKEIGYTGALTIEREVETTKAEERHVAGLPHRGDVLKAVALLEKLRG
ncbi:MAG: sugar phosphate isomerase/epimerase [Bryobacteraceae bacterium]|nr:sugar phosphate isomerase/epimerase [Bryobacteraceae bacterium]